MERIFVGVDPGKSGAFAILWAPGKVSVYPWDDIEFAEAMQEVAQHVCVACVERVGVMPRDGGKQAFSFGKSAGFIEGVLTAYNIPYQLVLPQTWKKEFSVTADKSTSITICKRLFPKVSLKRTDRCKVDHDGMAEALLLAEYAKRKF